MASDMSKNHLTLAVYSDEWSSNMNIILKFAIKSNHIYPNFEALLPKMYYFLKIFKI